jgi:VWFA-related protein
MGRVASLAGAGLAAMVVCAVPDAVAQEKPAFPTATRLVTIDAVVLDRDGRPVRGLTRDDFQLAEDGEPQAITHFEAVSMPPAGGAPPPRSEAAFTTSSNEAPPAAAPRSFVIVYDDIHIAPLRAVAAQEAVSAFLRREVRAGERAAVVFVGSGAWWTAEIPEGLDDLLAFLDGQSSGRSTRSGEDLTDAEAQRIAEYDDAAVREWVVERWVRQGRCEDLCEFVSPCDTREGRRACSDQVRAEALQRNEVARHGLRRTLGTMASAMAGVGPERGRKALLLVSEGFLFDPGNPAYREVVQASLRANAAVHFLDVRGLQATSPVSDVSQRGDLDDSLRASSEDSQLAAAGAEQVAEDSGGFAIRHGNDLSAGLARVAREAETYYMLGYEPPRARGRRASGRSRSRSRARGWRSAPARATSSTGRAVWKSRVSRREPRQRSARFGARRLGRPSSPVRTSACRRRRTWVRSPTETGRRCASWRRSTSPPWAPGARARATCRSSSSGTSGRATGSSGWAWIAA